MRKGLRISLKIFLKKDSIIDYKSALCFHLTEVNQKNSLVDVNDCKSANDQIKIGSVKVPSGIYMNQ